MAKIKFSSLISSKLKLVRNELDIPANTLEELFEKLDSNVNGLRECLFIEPGVVNPFFAIFINDEKIGGKYNNISLNNNDEVMILNMIAGG